MAAWSVLEFDEPFRPPLAPANLFGHLAATAVPAVEEWLHGRFRAAVRLAHGPAIVSVGLPATDTVRVRLLFRDRRDVPDARRRVRRLLDLDADPAAESRLLERDPVLAPLMRAVPGRRVPGTLDPAAMALRAVLGQQVSTAAARTHAGRLAAALGRPIDDPEGALTRLFPEPDVIAAHEEALVEVARMPARRRSTLLHLARAIAGGAVTLEPDSDVALTRRALAALPGIGPWTVDTIAMRALGDRDAFLPTDLGVIAAARRLSLPDDRRRLEAASCGWSPYRAVAVQYLWATGVHAVNELPMDPVLPAAAD